MLQHQELSDEILHAFFQVYNELGYGFLEKVYKNAMYFELKNMGLKVVPEKRCAVHYKKREVGEYFSDLIIEDKIILELKAAKAISEGHVLQLQNYLKASLIEVGYVLNFGEVPEFSRKIFSNSKKNLKK